MLQRWTILCALLVVSCNNDNNEPETEASGHIKYFGFTLVDTFWDDPTDSETKTNYSDEVATFSNIADILVVGPSDDIVSQMQAMSDLKMKSILHLNEIFFELVGSNAPSGSDYQLRPDAQERWDTFLAVNSLYVNQELVQALYIAEEPTWNGITFTELKKVADYIKTTIPGITIMIIEAYPSLDDLQIPASVDWIGFDHYFIKDPQTNSDFISELGVLKSKLIEDQKLVFIMDTHFIETAHQDFGGIALNEMKNVATSYYELAKKEPKTIAILGYFWPNGFDDASAIGARNMPKTILQEYIRIGKEISGK